MGERRNTREAGRGFLSNFRSVSTGFFTAPKDPALTLRLTRLERKLDAIMAHLGIEEADDGMEDLRALIASGNKIGAIKLYRDRTGAGLAEAKAAIDSGLV